MQEAYQGDPEDEEEEEMNERLLDDEMQDVEGYLPDAVEGGPSTPPPSAGPSRPFPSGRAARQPSETRSDSEHDRLREKGKVSSSLR